MPSDTAIPVIVNLAGFLEELQLLRFLDAATLTLLALEYLATLPLEVTLIWPTRLSHIKVLYFLNRHVVWVSVIAPRLANSTKCHTMNILANCGRVATVLVSEALLFARVWALSGNESLLGACLFGFWLAAGTAAFGLIIAFSLSAVFDLSPYPGIVTCIPILSNSKYSTPAVALIFLEQIVILSLSFYYGIRRHGTSGSHLGRIMYRDGLLYFVALTGETYRPLCMYKLNDRHHPQVLAILNALIQLTIRGNIRFVLNTFHFAMHAVLCNRMVLHLRNEAREKMGFTTQYDISILDAGPEDESEYSDGRLAVAGHRHDTLNENAHSIRLGPLRPM
ncbi:hypothetical protein FA13DRAFT_533994 [Coprinellus micaceus]|uniref:DUF6533 domain-containing protein n=1 Tax=Coprinellus micaceus TaxID=71717 RepID=A0A4Y7SBK5_COPMI|nr:hypothetical protein FA13DRAFT_533994 [Coprinellus micaceus]